MQDYDFDTINRILAKMIKKENKSKKLKRNKQSIWCNIKVTKSNKKIKLEKTI